jgi:hypothetical protein
MHAALAMARCAHCEVQISDPTTQVVHGDMTYCCANCAAAVEQTTGGSDPKPLSHAGDLRCAHCDCAIVDESSMVARGDQPFCCTNCASAMPASA